MLKRLGAPARSESGFTLVELLVVMLILGILAAIAITAFLNQRDKASDTGAKSMVRTMQTAEEACNTDNANTYVGCDLTALQKNESTIQNTSTATPLQPTNLAQRTFTVSAKSSTNTTFTIDRQSNGLTIRSCDAPNTGGCKKVGTSPTGTW
jgi:type IV pilus assembly protein PilA